MLRASEFAFYSVIKALIKTNFGSKVWLGLHSNVIFHQWGKAGLEPRGRNRSRDHGGTLLIGLFFMTCSAAFVMWSQTSYPAGWHCHHTTRWAPSHQPGKCPHSLAYRPIWWRYILKQGSSSQKTSLCQTGKIILIIITTSTLSLSQPWL